MFKADIKIETKKEVNNGIEGRTILKVSDYRGELSAYGFYTGVRNNTVISSGKFIPETEFQTAMRLHEKLTNREIEVS
jgi:hypothetical protein